ncbi:MAG: transposase [Deltaproteobacteria bacterium]|nr:transposase [Deltaproteobacteria bacterium]
MTWRLARGQAVLSDEERTVVCRAIAHFEGTRYTLRAWVVMDDHAHAILRPESGHPLSRILQSWKSFTAHVMVGEHGRVAPVWQEESYDRLIRDDRELDDTTAYVLGNPSRRWPGVEWYPWAGLGGRGNLGPAPGQEAGPTGPPRPRRPDPVCPGAPPRATAAP